MKKEITMALNKCACIDTLFTELPWQRRFQAAGDAGFTHVEFWSWTDRDLEEIKRLALEAGIGISGFNGDADYSLIDPAHKERYLEFLGRSLDAARQIGAESVTIHSNALGENGVVVNHYISLSDTVKLCCMYDMLLRCAPMAEKAGVSLHLEALNVHVDHVGNYLETTRMGAEICRLIGSPRLKLLYDVYHMQINEGNICANISRYVDQIGHVHVADAPGRHEPGTGEINYPRVLQHLEATGYKGLVGYELFPESTTEKAVQAIFV